MHLLHLHSGQTLALVNSLGKSFSDTLCRYYTTIDQDSKLLKCVLETVPWKKYYLDLENSEGIQKYFKIF